MVFKMCFRQFWEGVDPVSIRERITTVGVPVFRGEFGKMPKRGFRHDVGDFGRGVYYTSVLNQARAYGSDIRRVVLVLKHPLILGVEDAYDLSDDFEILHQKLPSELEGEELRAWVVAHPRDALGCAERMTRALLGRGFDGLVVVHRGGRLEIVDYRPYL